MDSKYLNREHLLLSGLMNLETISRILSRASQMGPLSLLGKKSEFLCYVFICEPERINIEPDT